MINPNAACVLQSSLANLCYVLCLVAQPCLTLFDPMDRSPPGFSDHEDSPGKNNTGVGCHALLQRIFPIQGSNPGIEPALQVDSLPSEPPGKPLAYPCNFI